MNELIEWLPPDRVKEINARLEAHFLGEGHFGAKLPLAFRNAAKRIPELVAATGISDRELARFLLFMVKVESRAMRKETEACFGAPAPGPWHRPANHGCSLI